MREKTVTTKIYKFDELSDEAKQTAIEGLGDINVDHEWWDNTYEDAVTIGLKITGFGLSREAYCRGKWIEDAEATARLIQEHHGEVCETYKDATEFQNAVSVQGSIFMDRDDDKEFTDSDEYEELCSEFLRTLCEDYLIILQKEYKYLTGNEAIIESIKANECEFTTDGTHYTDLEN